MAEGTTPRRVTVRARTTDPETSHQAALNFEQNQTKAQRSVATVVKILQDHGALTDFQIRDLWGSYWPGTWSYTLPCKARHWAREAGLVRFTGQFGQHQGRKVRLWSSGRDVLYLEPKPVCPHCGQTLKVNRRGRTP